MLRNNLSAFSGKLRCSGAKRFTNSQAWLRESATRIAPASSVEKRAMPNGNSPSCHLISRCTYRAREGDVVNKKLSHSLGVSAWGRKVTAIQHRVPFAPQAHRSVGPRGQ